MGFKENLRRLREASGLTQGEAADRAGVPFRSYQNWETGVREPRLQALADLASALGVTVDELLKDSPAKPSRLPGRPPKADIPPVTPATPPASELEDVAK